MLIGLETRIVGKVVSVGKKSKFSQVKKHLYTSKPWATWEFSRHPASCCSHASLSALPSIDPSGSLSSFSSQPSFLPSISYPLWPQVQDQMGKVIMLSPTQVLGEEELLPSAVSPSITVVEVFIGLAWFSGSESIQLFFPSKINCADCKAPHFTSTSEGCSKVN